MWLACIDQIVGLKDGPTGARVKVIFLNTMAFWVPMVTWSNFILDLMPVVHLDQFKDLLVCLVLVWSPPTSPMGTNPSHLGLWSWWVVVVLQLEVIL